MPKGSIGKWMSVFWPFWIYIAIYLILTMISFVLFSMQLVKYCSKVFFSNTDMNIQALQKAEDRSRRFRFFNNFRNRYKNAELA